MPTWTTPTTSRAAGYVPTAAVWNSELVENMRYLQYNGAMQAQLEMEVTATASTNNRIPSGYWFTPARDSSKNYTWETDPGFSTGDGLFTVPTGMGGWWNFTYWVSYGQWMGSADWHGVKLARGGASPMEIIPYWNVKLNGYRYNAVISGSWSFWMTAGDTMSLMLLQSSGATQYAASWLHGQWMSGGSGTRPAAVYPSLPTIGAQYTAAEWNGLMGCLKWMHERPFCYAHRTAVLNIPNTTETIVPLNDADYFDASAMHDPASGAPEQIFAPLSGLYLCDVVVQWDNAASAAGGREIRARRHAYNGAGSWYVSGDTAFNAWLIALSCEATPSNAQYPLTHGSAVIPLRQGDYVDFTVYQDSTFSVACRNVDVQVTYLGPLRSTPYGSQVEAPSPGRWFGW